jgi:hypothetical protein
LLFPIVPDAKPISVSGVQLAVDPAFKRLEVYAVDSDKPTTQP